jgi:hypothetical protein
MGPEYLYCKSALLAVSLLSVLVAAFLLNIDVVSVLLVVALDF